MIDVLITATIYLHMAVIGVAYVTAPLFLVYLIFRLIKSAIPDAKYH